MPSYGSASFGHESLSEAPAVLTQRSVDCNWIFISAAGPAVLQYSRSVIAVQVLAWSTGMCVSDFNPQHCWIHVVTGPESNLENSP